MQGVDWSAASKTVKADRDGDSQHRPCNGGMNPIQPGFNDGISIEPMEVMFVKVKAAMLAAGNWPSVNTAVKYAQWIQLTDAHKAAAQSDSSAWSSGAATLAFLEGVTANAWRRKHRPAILADANRRGQACFDHEFYVASSYDLAALRGQPGLANIAWTHFLNDGILEGRPHRFVC